MSAAQLLEPRALKKAGAALLSVAPSSHSRPYVFLVQEALGASSSSGRAAKPEERVQLEERAEYKLAREKPSAKGAAAADRKLAGRSAFAMADPERACYQLYRIDRSAEKAAAMGPPWVKVDA